MSPSTFARHQTNQLLEQALVTQDLSPPSSPHGSHHLAQTFENTERLRALLLEFKTSINPKLIRDVLSILEEEQEEYNLLDSQLESHPIQNAALGAVASSLYGQMLHILLEQATAAEDEATWWADVERSRRNLLWYMLQTLPLRLSRAFYTIVGTLHSRNLAITPRAFTPGSLRDLFPSTISRPSKLTISIFPHLSEQSKTIFRSPLELTRQECRLRREALEEIRNDRAERLGVLAMSKPARLSSISDQNRLACTLDRILTGLSSSNDSGNIISTFSRLNNIEMPRFGDMHAIGLSGLRRPSRFIQLWPRFVIIPPAAYVIFRVIFASQKSFSDYMLQFVETIRGFWENYLIQPLRSILDTVRTGGEDGLRLITPEGVKADTASLERMALELIKEKYKLSNQEIAQLAVSIRQGDLTPVLKVYEEDMKTPLRSAIVGTLVRSLLIQIQKMKVDVDNALAGIDKLLRSQELTFAFVGVAPALAVVYAIFGWARNVWQAGQGRGKYGGARRRKLLWLCLRRIERILVLSSRETLAPGLSNSSLTALDQGLILLSVSQLRSYGEFYLPPRIKEEFLIDVSDLEDSTLGRMEKMAIVNRMWRSWKCIFKSVASK